MASPAGSTEIVTQSIEAPELEKKSTRLHDRAVQITITDQLSYDGAVQFVKDLAKLQDEIEDHHREPKQLAHQAHAAICAAERKLLDPVRRAISAIKLKLTGWEDTQRRIEEERARIAREEFERAQAEAIEAACVEAEAEGASVEEVAQIIESVPIVTQRMHVAPTFERAKGISTPVRYKAEITNLRMLCKEIADGRQPVTLLGEIDMSPLSRMANALKGQMSIPGVRAVRDISVRVSRK